MLKFRKAEKKDKDIISSLLRLSEKGAVAFSVLQTSPDSIADFFLVGENEECKIESIVFDTGDSYFLIYGEEFPPFITQAQKIIMIYTEKACKKEEADTLQGKEILELYKMLSGTNTLSFDDERRYVLRLRAINHNRAAVFGIREASHLVSSASVSSMNEKYAVISDVFTAESHRRKGLAYRCLMAATEFSLCRGRIPLLLCDEKMCPYYEKAGFKIYGKM